VIGKTCPGGFLFHNALGQGAAADVAETNHQDYSGRRLFFAKSNIPAI